MPNLPTAPSPQRYLAILGLAVAATLVAGTLSFLLLLRSYELASPQEIVDLQRRTGAIYGAATADSHKSAEYRRRLYLMQKPDVAVIGSSRAMRFRDWFFTASFVNLGGLINQPEDSFAAVDALLSLHRPKLILLTVDFWWFTPKFAVRTMDGQLRQRAALPRPEAIAAVDLPPSQLPDLFEPVRWLAEGRLTLGDVHRILLGHPVDDDIFPPRLGVLALKQASGFGSDGSSYHDTGVAYGWTRSVDYQFQRTREWMAQHRSGFECASRVDEARFTAFQKLLKRIEATGAQVVTLMPPLAGAILDLMTTDNSCYAYVTDLRRRLPEISAMHFDYHDMRPMGVTDCEFLDGYHPGDVVDARMLLDMADRTGLLARFVDRPMLARAIDDYQGHAFINRGYGDRHYREIDFLGLGSCPRKAGQPAPVG